MRFCSFYVSSHQILPEDTGNRKSGSADDRSPLALIQDVYGRSGSIVQVSIASIISSHACVMVREAHKNCNCKHGAFIVTRSSLTSLQLTLSRNAVSIC